ncbi:MAG: hypothetical protein PHX52_00325 [Candidatus Pacebacteria bacterium]|nr:hypothetical protein [Candidatus Paceibacterota bacterium]MDD3919010.1 hypothetical protein [Candidatus Paceibacterota bacterium]
MIQVLIVGKNKEDVKNLLANAESAAKEFKDIEVSFFKEEDETIYELPLVVVNNLIVSSGTVLEEKDLREIFKNPPEGCSGSCGSCGGGCGC